MTATNLERVSNLCKAFGHSVDRQFRTGYAGYASEQLGALRSSEPNHRYLESDSAAKIAFANIIAQHAGTNEGRDKVAALIPAALKNEESVALLRSMDADALVELCTRPAPRQRKFGIFPKRGK